MVALANSEDPDEMLQDAAFHQGLHSSGTEIHLPFEILTRDPLCYLSLYRERDNASYLINGY